MRMSELDAAMQAAKRITDEGDQPICSGAICNDALTVARALSAAKSLLAALHEGRRAIGDHSAPSDCYATGPLTGDPYRDLVQCPACSFIAMYDAAVAATSAPKDSSASNERPKGTSNSPTPTPGEGE